MSGEKKKVWLLKVDGTKEDLPNDRLKTLQKAVGGNIELVKTNKREDMYIHEEGKLLGLPINQQATLIYINNLNDFICGDVVLIKRGA